MDIDRVRSGFLYELCFRNRADGAEILRWHLLSDFLTLADLEACARLADEFHEMEREKARPTPKELKEAEAGVMNG